MIKKQIHIFLIIIFLLGHASCQNSSSNSSDEKAIESTPQPQKKSSIFHSAANAVFELRTYDNDRILETGKCFLVTSNTLVAPFSLFSGGANKGIITPLNGGEKIEIDEYYELDRINNLILLHVDGIEPSPLKLYGASKTQGLKTTVLGKRSNNTQPLYTGSCLEEQILQGRKLLSISNQIGKQSQGMPVLVSNGSVLGMGITEMVNYKPKHFAVPVGDILELLNRKKEKKPLSAIGLANARNNQSVKKIILETDFGNISIRLYNETPTYRDNFIQLATEGFYDSLLIHRVIRDFGIQTGAADTRHAKIDDIVGWKGPGYTLPAHIIPELFHHRGAIGSPRKPDDKNQDKRSDGSQFYIVTGRKYVDEELDEFEDENNIKYTAKQREIYKTLGGSPHLDGSYTVFGEVVAGLEVADRITLLPVQADFRPISNIRLKKVSVEF